MGARDTIRKVFGATTASKIVRTACNPWGIDQWAMGSWTIAKPGGAAARQVLGRPIDNRIFFAGEVYTPQIYGTTQAAYVTGQKAAAAFLRWDN